MYKYLGKLKESGQKGGQKGGKKEGNCIRECEKCYMCQQETRDFNDCWESCDACNRCHADIHSSKPDKMPEVHEMPSEVHKMPSEVHKMPLHPWFQLSWFQLYK